ncbi:MAG: phosphomannomutase / phosphoglucomutase, partial [Desulfobacteraceae bacterium Eth-SRB1]
MIFFGFKPYGTEIDKKIFVPPLHDSFLMTKKKLFGTNGVRGIANKTMTAETSLKLGLSLGTYLHKLHDDATGVVAVARDTRISGSMLKNAAVSGVLSAGCSVVDVGIVPIPALQYYVRDHADAGIMITASHNPREYNGLKLIAGDGTEFSREDEAKVEELYYGKEFYFADWSMTGNLRYDASVAERYM